MFFKSFEEFTKGIFGERIEFQIFFVDHLKAIS